MPKIKPTKIQMIQRTISANINHAQEMSGLTDEELLVGAPIKKGTLRNRRLKPLDWSIRELLFISRKTQTPLSKLLEGVQL